MFRLNPFIRAGLSASVVSLAFPALADVNEETLVVTASATEQNVKDAPASISVITQQDLQRKPVPEPERRAARCARGPAHQRRG